MEEKNYRRPQFQLDLSWRVVGIFCIAIYLICGFVFLRGYSRAYDYSYSSGVLVITPSFSISVKYFFLVLFFVFSAIILKLIFKEQVRFWILFLCAVILPVFLCYFNCMAFNDDGFLYYMVEDGGIFSFIVRGDFNFDGINDETYRLMYKERTHRTGYGGHYNDEIIDDISCTAVGTGMGLVSTGASYNWEKRVIKLCLDDDTSYKQVELLVVFHDSVSPENVEFFLDGVKLIPSKVTNSTILFIFDAEQCARWQRNSDKESIYLPIDYKVTE